MKKKTMTKTVNRVIYILLCAILCAGVFVGCGKDNENYEGSIIVSNTTLIGYRDYLSQAETALGMTITDSMYYATMPENDEEKPLHISLVNSGSFPAKQEDGVINSGGVYEEDLVKIVPKDRTVVVKKVKGNVIMDLAENSVHYMLRAKEEEKYDDNVFHFSGIAFVYNKKNGRGDRIIDNAMINETKLDREKYYTVAMNSSLAESERFAQFETVKDYGSEYDMLVKHLKEHGVSSLNNRYVDKAERDAPMIAIIVVAVVLVLAIAGIIIAYFVLKKKQKIAKIKRGGQPRIDV